MFARQTPCFFKTNPMNRLCPNVKNTLGIIRDMYRDDFIDVLERVEKLCDKMEYLGSYSEKF